VFLFLGKGRKKLGTIAGKEQNDYLCTMKKEIGKWLMDVAKYVATAILISSFLNGFEEKWMVFVGGSVIVIACFAIGLYFINYKD
jgi:hypothetical protein